MEKKRYDLSCLDAIPAQLIIDYLKGCDEWPKEKRLADFSDPEIMHEFRSRGMIDDQEDDDDSPVADEDCLNKAIDQCRWGNVGMCGVYLIAAIPELWPLGKLLGADA